MPTPYHGSTAVVVLGMHRSGTSCLAAMLRSVASAGDSVRNWDNARGHHEMLDVVRLNEAVLAHSGGHWLAAPATVRWTQAHAAERDRLLQSTIDGRAALLKDPRTLLVLPFWRASSVPFAVIGIVRHPLAVARSLESWRGMALADGLALWSAHNRVLAADRARHAYVVVDFEQPKAAVVAVVRTAFPCDASAYEEDLVHHDIGDAPASPELAEAIALYRELGGAPVARRAFPREAVARAGDGDLQAVREALGHVADAAAVLVPVVTALVRRRAYADARAVITEHAAHVDAGLAELLHGKVLLAMGDAAGAVRHLEAACAIAQPYFQARSLLPQALRGAGRHDEARAALARVPALYPHGPLATLAEWSWLDGARDRALTEMATAIAAAPLHRRGRLRTRRAEWLLDTGDAEAARAELALAHQEDPGYRRSREVADALTARGH